MSASEKMKGLREWDGLGDPWLTDRGKLLLLRSFPQLVAVVEAAEADAAKYAAMPTHREGLTPERSERLRIERELVDALAALEGALS